MNIYAQMLFSTFSGTRFQTNLEKIRQIQTNFRGYNVFLKMFLTFYQNVSWEISFSYENLIFSKNLSAKCQYPSWKCVWFFFLLSENVNISSQILSELISKFVCQMSIFLWMFWRSMFIDTLYLIRLIPNWYFMCN